MTYKNDWDGLLSKNCVTFIKAQIGVVPFCKKKGTSTATGVYIGGNAYNFDVYGFAHANDTERATFADVYTVLGDGINSVEFAIS
jgi:hypothetical protein